jgi:hypothetical protein
MGFAYVIGTAHSHPLGSAVGIPEVPTEHLAGPTGCKLKSSPVRKSFPFPEPLGRPFVPSLGMVGGQNRGIDPML